MKDQVHGTKRQAQVLLPPYELLYQVSATVIAFTDEEETKSMNRLPSPYAHRVHL